jgi:O-antigen/teichoic acid export membrane protein
VAEEGTSARVVRNTLVNGLGSVSAVLITLALTPFLITHFGVTAYGVFALSLTFSFLGGYASLADLGIEGAVARYVAEARSDEDLDAVNGVVSTGLAFFLCISLVLTPVMVGASIALVQVFDIPAELHGAAVACFALVAGQLVFELPARIAYAVLEGAQRFGTYQAIELVRAATQAIGFVLVILLDGSIAGLGATVTASSLVVLVLGWTLARRSVPGLQVRRSHVQRAVLRKLMSFGGALFVIRLTGTIYRQMDKLIIGVALGASFVTTYEIANRIHAGAAMVQSIAASALLPAAAFSRSRADILRDMFLRGTSYTVAVSLPVTAATFIFAEPLIRTWVGERLLDATASTRLFAVYLSFAVVHIVGATMVVGLGHVRFTMLLAIANLAINIVISISLVGPLGIEGVVLGTVIAQILVWPFLLRFFLRRFEVGLAEWWRQVVVVNVPGLVLQSATALPLLWLADRAGNLAEVGVIVLVSITISLVGFVAFGLGRPQRAVLIGTLRRALGLRVAA